MITTILIIIISTLTIIIATQIYFKKKTNKKLEKGYQVAKKYVAKYKNDFSKDKIIFNLKESRYPQKIIDRVLKEEY